MRTISFNQFDGGMVNDPRDPSENVSRSVQHFDAFTARFKLTPYRSAITDTSGATASLMNYQYYQGVFYGLGIVNGGTSAALYTRADNVNATSWVSLIGNTGSARTDAETCAFKAYHGKLYGVRGGRYIYAVTISGPSLDGSNGDLTSYTNVSNMVVHSKDDILYLGYDNKIASKNDTAAWNPTALTLPQDYIITSIAEYGNFLAIGCRPQNGIRSRVYLWDRDSSLTTLSESIDWGEGNLMLLEELEGSLIGVSFSGTTGNYNIKQRMTCRYYSSSQGAIKFAEMTGFSQNPPIQATLYKFKSYNRVFFPASMPIGSTIHQGVWSVGRRSVGVPFGLTLDRKLNNDTLITSNLSQGGIYLLGDFMYQSWSNNSTYYANKTDASANYTATSIYETTINPEQPERYRASAGVRSSNKQVVAVALSNEPLTSGQQVVLKYRVDGGAWTTILTQTVVGTVTTERVKDATGTSFTSGREYEFRIESTGGAEPTELKYKYEVLETFL